MNYEQRQPAFRLIQEPDQYILLKGEEVEKDLHK
jgi:hypothetical protein